MNGDVKIMPGITIMSKYHVKSRKWNQFSELR